MVVVRITKTINIKMYKNKFLENHRLHSVAFQFIVELKDRYDDIVEELLVQEKVNGYSCTLEYKGNSFILSKICLVVKNDGNPIFTEIINIW